MTEIDEIRQDIAALTARQEKFDGEISAVEERVTTLEARVTTLDSKMDTLLDGVSQIKAVLNDNTSISRSARRNTRGWGFISCLITIVSAISRVIFFWR